MNKSQRRLLAVGLVLAGVAFVALRVLTLTRVAFNWDEFAFFDTIAHNLAEGRLRTGGRPGLAQLLVAPLVADCTDEIAVGRAARGLWLAITLTSLAGLFAMLAEAFRTRRERYHDAAVGVALIALLPVFLEWSIQVRTDHIAIAGGLWGGTALLCSERKRGYALLAGIAFGVGWLSSQKLAYVATLACTLALGRLWMNQSFDRTREIARGLLLLAGIGTVLLCYRTVVLVLFSLPETHPATQIFSPTQLIQHMTPFAFYRATLGFDQYRAILPTLVPHIVLCASLGVTLALGAERQQMNRSAVVGLAVLGVGCGVGLFHAAAFSYFWMTLGLFPAVASAFALDGIRRQWLDSRPQWRRPAAIALWAALLIPATLSQASLLRDTQAVQRNSLEFASRHFAGSEGFHPEGGPFCQTPNPKGIWFSHAIFRHFEGPDRDANIELLLERFRSGRVPYLMESFRLGQFPAEVREFWGNHYQPYRDSIFVAGRRFIGDEGTDQRFDLVVPGRYRWIPQGTADSIEVAGVLVPAGGEIDLEASEYSVRIPANSRGILVLSLDEAPAMAPLAFYKSY